MVDALCSPLEAKMAKCNINIMDNGDRIARNNGRARYRAWYFSLPSSSSNVWRAWETTFRFLNLYFFLIYHRFRWYATLENKILAETFPKISVNHTCYRHVGSKSTNHSPLAWPVIDGFRSDMSITRMIDGNFWKRFRECFVFQSRVSTKTVVTLLYIHLPSYIHFSAAIVIDNWDGSS